MRTLLLTLGAGLLPLMAVLSACSSDESAAQPQQEVAPAEAARAAFDAWQAGLESFESIVDVGLSLSPELEGEIEVEVRAQLDPIVTEVSLDAADLLEAFAGQETVMQDPFTVTQSRILTTEEGSYMEVAGLGWFDVSDELGPLMPNGLDLLGADPQLLTDPELLGVAFICDEAADNSTIEGVWNEHDVWWISCTVDSETLNSLSDLASNVLAVSGIRLEESDFESLNMRLAVDRDSGAPLRAELEVSLPGFGFLLGGDDVPNITLSSTMTLLSWNEPIDFPAPEPLIDDEGGFATTVQSFRSDEQDSMDEPELESATEVISAADSWITSVDELHFTFTADANTYGVDHTVRMELKRSFSRGLYETAVSIDGGRTQRLHWSREGIWSSDSESGGEPIWTRSTPVLLGFEESSVDEYLSWANHILVYPLQNLRPDLSLSREQTGSEPAVYTVEMMRGPWTPDVFGFLEVMTMVEHAAAEVLAESEQILSVDTFSTSVRYRQGEGIERQQVDAEFETGSGQVHLHATLEVMFEPVEFSVPGG